MAQDSWRPMRCRMPSLSVVILWLLRPLKALAADADFSNPNNCIVQDGIDIDTQQSTSNFTTSNWISRGMCARQSTMANCYATMNAILSNVNTLHQTEHGGASTVLTLLPTIGALFGAPTSEIWIMLQMLPFGGWVALLVSFGGQMIPKNIEEYEKRNEGNTYHVIAAKDGEKDDIVPATDSSGNKHRSVKDTIKGLQHRLTRRSNDKFSKESVVAGLTCMVVLLVGAQAAMALLEQGGLLQWWCSCNWWMHLWYILVTFSSVVDTLANSPFEQQWKLYVSHPNYEYLVEGGQNINDVAYQPNESNRKKNHNPVSSQLDRLRALPAARVTMASKIKTDDDTPRMIIVSVQYHETNAFTSRTAWQLLSRVINTAVFVCGTVLFSNVALLNLPLTTATVVLVLAAGVFGRAICTGIISSVSRTQAMIHIITKDKQTASVIIGHILNLTKLEQGEPRHQIEIEGNIFLQQKRIARRSAWHVKTLGILADSFDLRKVADVINQEGTNSRYEQTAPLLSVSVQDN